MSISLTNSTAEPATSEPTDTTTRASRELHRLTTKFNVEVPEVIGTEWHRGLVLVGTISGKTARIRRDKSFVQVATSLLRHEIRTYHTQKLLSADTRQKVTIMANVTLQTIYHVGGGGSGDVVTCGGKKFPFKKTPDGSDRKRATEAAKKWSIAKPDPEWQRADGSMKSAAERKAFHEAKEKTQADINAKIAAKKRADAEKHKDPNPHAELLEYAKSEPIGPYHSRAARDRKVEKYQTLCDQWQEEQAIKKQEVAEQRELESSDEFQWLTDGIDATQNVSRADGFDDEVDRLELAKEYKAKGLFDEASAIVTEIQRAQLDRATDTKINASKQIADGHADYIAGMEREQAVKESQGEGITE